MPRVAGVYCFWWNGPLPDDTTVLVQGPKISLAKLDDYEGGIRRKVNYRKNTETYAQQLEGVMQGELPPPYRVEGYTCLYVGKSTNVWSRIGSHVCANTQTRSAYLTYRDNFVEDDSIRHQYAAEGPDYVLMKDTQSQFRAGLEYIFRHEDEGYAYQQMLKHTYVSYLCDAQHTFRDRFYLEDLAIGLLHPWFNLDSER